MNCVPLFDDPIGSNSEMLMKNPEFAIGKKVISIHLENLHGQRVGNPIAF